MTLEGTTLEIWNNMQTPPGFDNVREKANGASRVFPGAILDQDALEKGRDDAFNLTSKIYLESIGISLEGYDDIQYGQLMQEKISSLGAQANQLSTRVYTAIQNKDSGNLLTAYQDIFTQSHNNAIENYNVRRALELPKAERLKLYKQIAGALGGVDELKVAENLQESINGLRQYNSIRENFS